MLSTYAHQVVLDRITEGYFFENLSKFNLIFRS